ncbi:hypothetical protein [Burkholderia phage FLC9]|nr:hypothetical protein [Burkholderia phage FLC9]
MDNIILTFKDQQFPLAKVAAKGKSGPPVEVKLSELHHFNEGMIDLVKLSKECAEYDNGPIIFFKHEGKYIVFGGKENALEKLAKGAVVLKGYLLSTPALKSVRIEKPIAESAKVEAVTQLANKFSSSRPAPRTYDTKTPRTYGSNNRTAPRQASGNTLHARSGGNRSGS